MGRKALAANLSDLAAMAAKPLAGVVALALPRQGGMELAVALYEGMLPLAEQYDLAIAGGDTNSWDGPLAISITLLGDVTGRGPLCRGGARPGDRILVTGSFGGSILGRHLDFEPRVARGPGCCTRATNCTPASTSATACRSTWPTSSKRAAAGRCSSADAVPVADDARRLAETAGRRFHAAGPRPGRRRGFRVDPGRAPRRAAADAGRAAADRCR